MQSMTLSAHVPAEALQSSARQRLPGFAESPMWQSTYQSGNPANLPPSASLHHDLSSNPAHRGQPYPGSNIDPRTIGNDQYGSQQPGDQGSNYQFGGSGPQLSSVTGGDFDDFDDFVDMDAHWDFEDEQPTTQPPGPLDPYLQVSAYASASQSGFGQARTEAKGPVTTGDDELYSANDFSSPSGGSDQPPAPQRRRLEQGDSQGRAEQSQRYAAAGQEKRKKDSKHARGSQEKGKKTSKNKKDDSQKEKSTSTRAESPPPYGRHRRQPKQ